jgi:hypothetical protein
MASESNPFSRRPTMPAPIFSAKKQTTESEAQENADDGGNEEKSADEMDTNADGVEKNPDEESDDEFESAPFADQNSAATGSSVLRDAYSFTLNLDLTRINGHALKPIFPSIRTIPVSANTLNTPIGSCLTLDEYNRRAGY